MYSDGGINDSNSYTFGGPGSYNSKCSVPKGNFSPLTTNNGTTPYPATWDTTLAGAICGQSGAHVDFNPSDTVDIPANATGIWCAAGSIVDNNNNDTENITLVANQVTISGGHQTLTPFTQNLLFAMTGSGTLTLSDNNSGAIGDVYVPTGTVDLSGNQLSTSFVEAKDITITANKFSLIGDGPNQGGTPTTSTSTSTTTIPGTTIPSSTLTSTTGTSGCPKPMTFFGVGCAHDVFMLATPSTPVVTV